jgi:hypothetical protein
MSLIFLIAFLFLTLHRTSGFVSTAPRNLQAFGLSAVARHEEVQPVPVVMHIQELLGRHRWQELQSLLDHHSHLIVGLEHANPEFGRNVLSQLFDSSATPGMVMSESQLDRALRSLGYVWLRQQQLNKVFPHAKTVKARDLKRLLVGNPHRLRNALLNLAA